ncbi:hypothetical protein VTN31DRAFT_6257 [Thermomyces dupontii]|uniref:uncharacterized protein n=1 Tax=Talaromyces thermophilus TaxID=28565 RepID=UPI003742BADF
MNSLPCNLHGPIQLTSQMTDPTSLFQDITALVSLRCDLELPGVPEFSELTAVIIYRNARRQQLSLGLWVDISAFLTVIYDADREPSLLLHPVRLDAQYPHESAAEFFADDTSFPVPVISVIGQVFALHHALPGGRSFMISATWPHPFPIEPNMAEFDIHCVLKTTVTLLCLPRDK